MGPAFSHLLALATGKLFGAVLAALQSKQALAGLIAEFGEGNYQPIAADVRTGSAQWSSRLICSAPGQRTWSAAASQLARNLAEGAVRSLRPYDVTLRPQFYGISGYVSLAAAASRDRGRRRP
jgi:hypothetical protein